MFEENDITNEFEQSEPHGGAVSPHDGPTGMLEARHLKKEYKTKNGVVTKALDDVSLTFPETGMIFILGKSGSGKSTLLNVCGGLDRMDEGEIIIKGKSSKDFSAQDFDSYRNTYVGFVFQEYNILDEFTVAQNIALALELQNKKPDKDVVDKILADVDLTDFASRKPNTLSGGQKQRVAIARALVKEPQIIMADEPTGALDSKTGQQVFDTLKKLSKQKLVIVISHDRDFAEQYGDRIIELKDGQVISDQTRDEAIVQRNVRFFGTDTVCVTNGADITDEDLQSIKSFLAKSGGTAVISTSRERIAQLRDESPELNVGTFKNIDSQPAVKQYEPQKLIRSHLPVKHAIKMGGASLKTKPVRLVFTILLSIIAFVLFGLASTLMLFDGHDVSVQSFTDSKINYLSLGKIYYVTYEYSDGDSYTTDRDTKFTMEEYEKYAEKYDGAIPLVSTYYKINNLSIASAAYQFYSESLNNIVPASDKLKLLEGRMPQKDDEVAITDFMVEAVKSKDSRLVYGENSTPVEVNNYEDILYTDNKPVVLRINEADYKIVGVFKGSEVPAEYLAMKQAADTGEQAKDNFSSYSWSYEERQHGMYMTVAVTENVFKEAGKANGNNVSYDSYFMYGEGGAYIRADSVVSDDKNENNSYTYYDRFAKYEGKTLNIYGMDGTQTTTVGNGEAAISYIRLADMLAGVINTINNQAYDTSAYEAAREEYSANNPEPREEDFQDGNGYTDYNAYYEAREKYFEDREAYAQAALDASRKDVHKKYLDAIAKIEAEVDAKYRAEHGEQPDYEKEPEAYNEWWNGYSMAMTDASPYNVIYRLTVYGMTFTDEEIKTAIAYAYNLLVDIGADISFAMYNDTLADQNVKIVGYFTENVYYGCYLGEDLYGMFYKETYYGSTESTKYEQSKDAFIDNILIPFDGSRALIEEFLGIVRVAQEDDSALEITNALMGQLDTVIGMADMMGLVFIIVGAALALFAFLLMFNFISASITAKKKDIGILRAIGARTTDVFKIFISEALIIALICFVASTIITLVLCIVLNIIIALDVGLSVSLFVFGPLSVLSILGIGLVTALVSTVIPVSVYSRKPPIASIRSL